MGIGPMELLLVLVLSLVVFGPKKLPEIAAQIGKIIAGIRRTSVDFTRELNREIELDKTDVVKTVKQLNELKRNPLSIFDEEKKDHNLKKEPDVLKNQDTPDNTPPPVK